MASSAYHALNQSRILSPSCFYIIYRLLWYPAIERKPCCLDFSSLQVILNYHVQRIGIAFSSRLRGENIIIELQIFLPLHSCCLHFACVYLTACGEKANAVCSRREHWTRFSVQPQPWSWNDKRPWPTTLLLL